MTTINYATQLEAETKEDQYATTYPNYAIVTTGVYTAAH